MEGLSIVIPIYNRASLIERTLRSVAASTMLPHDLILVDNGSTDQSAEICRRWAALHSSAGFRVTVLSADRKGASVARNVGLQACSTEFVYFFDSDDLFDPAFIADATSALKAGSAPDLLLLDTCQEVNGRTQRRSARHDSAPHTHILNSQLNTISMLFRTAFLRQIGGWNETLTVWDDWELGLRALLARPKVRWLTPKAYHHVFVHTDSQTSSSFTQTLRPTLAAMRAALTHVRQSLWPDRDKARFLRALFFRSRIMEGHLLHEGCADGAHLYHLFAAEVLPDADPWVRLTGRLLGHYTRFGGRGAWRLALMLV